VSDLQILTALLEKGFAVEVADSGAILARFPVLSDFGLGIAPLGDGLDCYAFETYAGSDLGRAGHTTLDEAIAWALLLIVSCDAAMSVQLSTMKKEF